MKKWIVSLGFIGFSAAIFACPNLTGKYLCNDSQEGAYYSTISQKLVDGVTHYRVEEGGKVETIVADGVWKKMEDTEGDFSMQLLCDGENLHLNIKGATPSNDSLEAFGIINHDHEGNLVTETKIIYNGQTLPEQRTICHRQSK